MGETESKKTDASAEYSDDTSEDTGKDTTPDLEKVDEESLKDLDEDTQKKIKGFHKDYTRKTQALAAKEKELKEKAEMGEKWENWFRDNDSLVKEFNEWKAKKDNPPPADTSDDDLDLADPAVKKVHKSVAQVQKEMNELREATKVSSKMMIDLVSEIQRKKYRELPFEVEPRKVLNYARENNIFDMKKAIDSCYADDIKEYEFSKRLEEEKEKWTEKEKTNVLSAPMSLGRQPRKVLARKRE